MKRLALLLIITISIMSCDKLDKLTQFSLKYNQTVTIPNTFGINIPFDISTPEINTNSKQTFEGYNTADNLIESIKLTKLVLTMEEPANADFSFLSAIEIFISAEGLSEVKIASKTNIPNDAQTVVLELANVDLKEYIKADQFKMRLNTTTDELMSQNHKINVATEFLVDANVLGK